MLLVAMLLTVRSFSQLQAISPGFEAGNVLSVQLALPPVRYSTPIEINTFADTLHTNLSGLPRVREVSAISLQPLSGLLSTQDYRGVGRPEPPPNEVPQAHYRIVMPGYFRVMGIGLRGREFDDTDRDGTRRVAVISRTLADREWPHAAAIGEHILVGRDALEIVGVCDDVKQFGLDAAATADLYVPLRQMPAGQAQFVAARMYWVVRTANDPMLVADAVRGQVRRLDKDVAASSMRSMADVLAASTGSRRFSTGLIEIAGLSSLLLALIGVYAISAFSMSRRTHEIGIRIALGARSAEVVRSALASELSAIALGLAGGTAGAIFVSRLLSSVLFASGGIEPRLIAAAAAMLGVAALLAGYVPAQRAARIDPVAALKA